MAHCFVKSLFIRFGVVEVCGVGGFGFCVSMCCSQMCRTSKHKNKNKKQLYCHLWLFVFFSFILLLTFCNINTPHTDKKHKTVLYIAHKRNITVAPLARRKCFHVFCARKTENPLTEQTNYQIVFIPLRYPFCSVLICSVSMLDVVCLCFSCFIRFIIVHFAIECVCVCDCHVRVMGMCTRNSERNLQSRRLSSSSSFPEHPIRNPIRRRCRLMIVNNINNNTVDKHTPTSTANSNRIR